MECEIFKMIKKINLRYPFTGGSIISHEEGLAFAEKLWYITMHGIYCKLPKPYNQTGRHRLYSCAHQCTSRGEQVCPFEKDMSCMELGAAQRSIERDDLSGAFAEAGKGGLPCASATKVHPSQPLAPPQAPCFCGG